MFHTYRAMLNLLVPYAVMRMRMLIWFEIAKFHRHDIERKSCTPTYAASLLIY